MGSTTPRDTITAHGTHRFRSAARLSALLLLGGLVLAALLGGAPIGAAPVGAEAGAAFDDAHDGLVSEASGGDEGAAGAARGIAPGTGVDVGGSGGLNAVSMTGPGCALAAAIATAVSVRRRSS